MLSAKKGTCSNILDAKEVICSHFGCEPRHLFKHFGCKACWIRSKGICLNALDAQQALFKQSGCEGRHLQKQPICSIILDTNQRVCSKTLDAKTRLLFNFFPNILGLRLYVLNILDAKRSICHYILDLSVNVKQAFVKNRQKIFESKARHLFTHFGSEARHLLEYCTTNCEWKIIMCNIQHVCFAVNNSLFVEKVLLI